MTTASRPPISPGELAPDFALPSVADERLVKLADYRGQKSVFLALLVGLWCPFCRRHIAQMGALDADLKTQGVESLGIVATSAENARLYFKFRPTRLRLAADPDLTTHRAYGVPRPTPTSDFISTYESALVNPFGDFPDPVPIREAAAAITKLDGYKENDTDRSDLERQWPQLKGQFLIDFHGVVRWVNIECGNEGLAGAGKFPSAAEIIAAARTLPRS